MATIVTVDNLTKKYGRKIALDNISFKLEEGKVLGLLGPNGSGKTTLITILSAFHQITSGRVEICGKKPGVETKSMVSYLPDRNFLPKWMKIKDAKEYYNDFFYNFNAQTFGEMLEVMKLSEDMKVRELSKGMQEKLNLSLTLSRDASLYLLDEPIGGVDPVARDMILNSIIDKAFQNKTLIVSTQLVRDIESIFDEVMIMNEGKILAHETVDNLRMEKSMSVEEFFKDCFGGVTC